VCKEIGFLEITSWWDYRQSQAFSASSTASSMSLSA
jgi:hypothetical protein